MNLPALKKAIVTATSRSRNSRGKQGGNNTKDKEEVEEIKPLIVRKKVEKAHIKNSEKELVVDVETLSFRPADGRLQTARRGRPFMPGNLHGHHRGGGRGSGYKHSQNIESDDAISVDDEGSGKGDDEIETDDNTSYARFFCLFLWLCILCCTVLGNVARGALGTVQGLTFYRSKDN